MARPRLPIQTHDYIRRGHQLGFSVEDLARLFNISAPRVYQILENLERAKVDGKWIYRQKGSS
jgi:Mor family transcriptional regulator